jgi:hypothetical protein
MVTVWLFVGGADIGGSDFAWSLQLQQLLDLDEPGEVGEALSAGAEVAVHEMLEAEEAADVTDVVDAVETGRLPSNLNVELVPVANGLISTGDSVLRKSR